MRFHVWTMLPALAPALLLACTSAGSRTTPPGITLSITPERPAPGSSLTLILRNQSEDTLGYNLCASGLERLVGGDAWAPVPEDRVCTMELRTLPTGQEATFPIDLAPDLEPGTYRYQTRIERMERGTTETVATTPFEVAG